MKYEAFISYRHAVSREFVQNLELALKAYAKPLWRPPVAIFRDEKYLRPGLDLPKMIKDALEQSEFFIYIASPEAADSTWVKDELKQWCSSASRLQRLIIILTKGTIGIDESDKTIDWENTTAIPNLLRPFLPTVPFYLEASAFDSATRQTLLDPDFKKLVNNLTATLRGIDPIQLSGQEIIQHRKNLRQRNLLISSTIVALFVTTITWFSLRQASEIAKQQKTIAQARQLAARSRGIFERTPYRIESAISLAAESMKRWTSSDADQMVRQGLSLIPDSVADLQHKSPVVKARLSPDGRNVVTVSDGRVYIWELPHAPAHELDVASDQGHVMTAAISPNGEYLLTGSEAGMVRVFKFPNGRSLGGMETHAKVTDILLTSDSRYFIVRTSSPVVSVGEIPDGHEVAQLPHPDMVVSLSLSSDGTRICTGTTKGNASLWDWRSQKLLHRFVVSGTVSSIVCSSGAWLAAADGSSQVQLWDLKKGPFPLPHGTPVNLLALSADDRLLAAASDRQLRVWDTSAWLEVSTFDLQNPLETLLFHPHSKLLAAAGQDNTARLWDLGNRRELARVAHENDVLDLSFDGAAKCLATASVDKSARVVAVPLEAVSPQWEQPKLTAATYTSNGSYLATGDRSGHIRIWQTEPEQPVTELQVSGGKQVDRLVFSPDDRFVAAADPQGTVRIIDVKSGGQDLELRHGARAKGIAFSPDGNYVATGGSDHFVRIWTMQGALWRTLDQGDEVNGLAFSPDSRRLAVTTGTFGQIHHNRLLVWGLNSDTPLQTKDQSDPLESTSFSMDGRYLVSTSQDFTARVWDANKIEEVALPLVHDLPVWSAAFSSDGKFLVTGSEDSSVRVWEWSSGRELVLLRSSGGVRFASFTANDRRIVAASFDPSGQLLQMRFWPWKAEDLLYEACSRVRHGLSQQEWHIFFGSEYYAPVCGALEMKHDR